MRVRRRSSVHRGRKGRAVGHPTLRGGFASLKEGAFCKFDVGKGPKPFLLWLALSGASTLSFSESPARFGRDPPRLAGPTWDLYGHFLVGAVRKRDRTRLKKLGGIRLVVWIGSSFQAASRISVPMTDVRKIFLGLGMGTRDNWTIFLTGFYVAGPAARPPAHRRPNGGRARTQIDRSHKGQKRVLTRNDCAC